MGTSAGACDGFPCVFFNTVSWRDDTSPLPMGINPRVTFERMFGETGSARKRLSNLKLKQSVLDSIAEEAANMQRRLGAADNAILDEYLTNVRDVEQQLDAWKPAPTPFPRARPLRRGSPIPSTNT